MTSTPTKPDEPVNPEFSMLSVIGVPNMSQRGFIDDTVASPFSPAKSNGKRKGNSLYNIKNTDIIISYFSASVPEFESLMESLDIKKAKKAGQYLDGCSVSKIIFFFI